MDIVDVLQGMKSGDIRTSLNVYGRAIDEITKLREQLALRDLVEMKLRERLAFWDRGDEALSTPCTPAHLHEWYKNMIGEPKYALEDGDTIVDVSDTEECAIALRAAMKEHDCYYAVVKLYQAKEFKA